MIVLIAKAALAARQPAAHHVARYVLPPSLRVSSWHHVCFLPTLIPHLVVKDPVLLRLSTCSSIALDWKSILLVDQGIVHAGVSTPHILQMTEEHILSPVGHNALRLIESSTERLGFIGSFFISFPRVPKDFAPSVKISHAEICTIVDGAGYRYRNGSRSLRLRGHRPVDQSEVERRWRQKCEGGQAERKFAAS